MSRIVRGGLIQATLCEPATSPGRRGQEGDDRQARRLIAEAAERGAQVVCLQELFYGPYFCAEQQARWYELTERVPDGPTTKLMCELARRHEIVLVVPVYEEDLTGVYYNTAAVIDADGTLPRQVSQDAHPACPARLLGEVLFPARQPRAIPSSRRASARSASTSATTAISPKGRAAWA